MNKKISNVYLFSAVRGREWSIIAATTSYTTMVADEDLLSYLGLSRGEREFADATLLDNVSIPLAVIGTRGEEDTAILIFRNTVFETSMCMALEFTSHAAHLLRYLYGRALEGVVASPRSRELVYNMDETDDAGDDRFAASCAVRAALALGDTPRRGRISGVSHLCDIISCVEDLAGVRVEFDIMNGQLDTNESGKVFSWGFAVCAVLAVAIAASAYSADGLVKACAFCDNGHLILDISYICAKRKVWSECDMLAHIADGYGIPLDIRETDGRLRCLLIPEYADEALNGIKENILWARDLSYSLECLE